MDDRQPNKIIGLITSILVLVGGFYLILFVRSGFSPMVKLIIGIGVVLYFMLRMRMIFQKKPMSELHRNDGSGGE